LTDIKEWCTERIPETYRVGLLFEVNEQICGDPSCAPIDTVFTFIWADGGRGMFALPLAPDEVQKEDIAEIFPDVETLDKWKRGIRCRWPPEPALRFAIGERVECRVGPHPVKGWAAGRIVRLHYSEPNWPPNMVAPYQIQLHDGRLIYAPQDVDQLIRLRPPAKETDPPSPEVKYPEDGGDLEDDEDDDDNDVEMEDISGGGAP
jgi:hypothetical protein